jgi:hypothetical protein
VDKVCPESHRTAGPDPLPVVGPAVASTPRPNHQGFPGCDGRAVGGSTGQRRLNTLEWAGVRIWQNRITRALVRQRDLFGRWSHRWTVIRTSNAYVFRDPQPVLVGVPAAKYCVS